MGDGALRVSGVDVCRLSLVEKRYSLKFFGDFLFVYDSFGQLYIFDFRCRCVVFNNDISSEKINVGNFFNMNSGNRVRMSKKTSGEEKYGFFNMADFSFTPVPVRFDFAFGELLYRQQVISNDKTVVTVFDKNSGKLVWQYDDFREYKTLLSGEIKTESVRSMLALVGETLWVLLDTGRIVGLDPVTGECKQSIEIDDVDLTHFENAETDFINARGIGSAYVSGEEKVIYLSSNVYFEIDLTADKPTRVCYNVKQTFKDRDVTGGGHQCVNSRYVFFNESMIGTIGAFDRQTKKVVWVDKLKNHKPDAGAVRELKATEDQLYVHDNKQNLFVFDLT
jgi:hypothetical protein